MYKVTQGDRPKRPRIDDRELRDAMWSLIESCWSQAPHKRPTASEIAVRVMGHDDAGSSET